MALTASLDIVAAPSLQASRVIQDLTYTAQHAGAAGDSITITYVDPGVLAVISVTVLSNTITVHLANDGMAVTSTASQIKTAVDASSPAHALVSVAVSGTGSTVQTAQSVTSLQNGFDTAIEVPANQPVRLRLAVSNSGGSPVVIDSAYPRVSSPDPKPSCEFTNPIIPQPVSIPAAGTVYLPFNFIIFGSEAGEYDVNVDVCSSASQLLATPSISASITLA